jgi:hypothetical protein
MHSIKSVLVLLAVIGLSACAPTVLNRPANQPTLPPLVASYVLLYPAAEPINRHLDPPATAGTASAQAGLNL